ncbi:MAG: M23 family metallopeptidase [Clostridiaceae bacterium]|nr:M23 family metallopeptidase [Clostridiaceae bacterium]
MNNKGKLKDNLPEENRFKSFFKESGFYIAIVVGLCALAAGAVYFSTNQILSDPEPEPYQVQENEPQNDYGLDISQYDNNFDNEWDQSSIVEEGIDSFEDDPFIGMEDLSPGESEAIENAEEAPDINTTNETNPLEMNTGPREEDASVATTGQAASIAEDAATEDVVLAVVRPDFKPPVAGKIQTEYSMDKLIFSPTFNEWRTHSGVDIAAPRGEVVRAVGNGVIAEIKNDPRYGFTIVIDHNNGYKSVYSNLVNDQTMQVGQEVKQGDPIGAVGATAIFESAEPTHIHFELYKENKLVDPAAYIDFPK